MADQSHLDILEQGVEAWNSWRERNASVRADLFRAYIPGKYLSGADLSGADLSKASLSSAKLVEANLSGARLPGAELSGANLFRANLSGVNLSKAVLFMADLSGADLIKANLTEANLSRANLYKANISGARLSMTNFSNADLSRADLSKAKISRAKLSGSMVDFSGAMLSGANLSEADLSKANFSDAYLSGLPHHPDVDLSDADLLRAKYADGLVVVHQPPPGQTSTIRVGGQQYTLGTVVSSVTTTPTDRVFYKPKLSEVDLSNPASAAANLSGANLSQAKFYGANLSGANLSGANLSGADLSRADLSKANLSGADLSNADLTRSTLVQTNLQRTNLKGCRIYGISAWNLNLKGTKQWNLNVSDENEPAVMVDDLEVAQFIHLLLNHKKLQNVLNAITERGVLILGRFGGGGIDVLEAIAAKLRESKYLPFIFDFDRPTDRNYTETVKTLVGLSRFVIVDLSGPSVPHELHATVPHFKIPFVPIIEEGRRQYSMVVDILEYPWVLNPPVRFVDVEHLVRAMPAQIIAPAEKRAKDRQDRLADLFDV